MSSVFMNDREVIVHDLAHAALSRALVAAEHGWGTDREVRQSLRQACTVAREHGLQAEQLLIIIKKSWRSMAVRASVDRRTTQSTLNDVITLCIQEFYEPANH